MRRCICLKHRKELYEELYKESILSKWLVIILTCYTGFGTSRALRQSVLRSNNKKKKKLLFLNRFQNERRIKEVTVMRIKDTRYTMCYRALKAF